MEVTCSVTETSDVPASLDGAPGYTEFRKYSHSNSSEGARQHFCIRINNSWFYTFISFDTNLKQACLSLVAGLLGVKFFYSIYILSLKLYILDCLSNSCKSFINTKISFCNICQSALFYNGRSLQSCRHATLASWNPCLHYLHKRFINSLVAVKATCWLSVVLYLNFELQKKNYLREAITEENLFLFGNHFKELFFTHYFRPTLVSHHFLDFGHSFPFSLENA